jgi:hypothetical protein
MLWGRDHTVDIPEIFPRLIVFPKKDLALDQAAVAIQLLDGFHVLSGQGFTDNTEQIGEDIPRISSKKESGLVHVGRPT